MNLLNQLGLKLKQNTRSSILISLGFVLILLFLVDCHSRPKPLVFFDVKETTHLFLQQAASQSLSSENQKKLTLNFSKIVEETIQRYAKEHHVIVLVKSAMIEGGHDATSEIQLEIAKTMQTVKVEKHNAALSL